MFRSVVRLYLRCAAAHYHVLLFDRNSIEFLCYKRILVRVLLLAGHPVNPYHTYGCEYVY